MQVCIDARMAYSSGIGTCIREIALRLPHKPILLVDKPDQSWCSHLEQIVVKAPIYSIKEQIALPKYIPRCDVFWSPHYNVPIAPIRAKKRVVTIHDVCHLAFPDHLNRAQKFYAKRMLNRAYQHSDAVATDSAFSASELSCFLGFSKAKFAIIPMGVSRLQFQKTEHKISSRLPEKFLLFVGNLKPHKNIDGLLKAFSQITTEHHLVLVGNLQEVNRALCPQKSDKVHVISNVSTEELTALYSKADLFIMPSFYEGFGLPPLEAMSCGCPTLVSHAASLPEVCGDASVYFDPSRPEDLAKAISQVSQSEEWKKMLIEKGKKRVELFSWQKTADRYSELFERVL